MRFFLLSFALQCNASETQYWKILGSYVFSPYFSDSILNQNAFRYGNISLVLLYSEIWIHIRVKSRKDFLISVKWVKAVLEKKVKCPFNGGPSEVKFRDTTQTRCSIWKHTVQSRCHRRGEMSVSSLQDIWDYGPRRNQMNGARSNE